MSLIILNILIFYIIALFEYRLQIYYNLLKKLIIFLLKFNKIKFVFKNNFKIYMN